MGYSLTSDTVAQTKLWELATYDLKPRLNRMSGVSTVVVQGGEEPEHAGGEGAVGGHSQRSLGELCKLQIEN